MTRLPDCGCTPYKPVGPRLVHSRYCPKFPNQALSQEERAQYRAMKLHPAGKHRGVPHVIPALPPLDPTAYADYWSDRDDDPGPFSVEDSIARRARPRKRAYIYRNIHNPQMPEEDDGFVGE